MGLGVVHLPSNAVILVSQGASTLLGAIAMDTNLLHAAQQIYRSHIQLRPDVGEQSPRGVVIHRRTLRGDLIFSEYPILLPHELFIPVDVLDQQKAS